MTGEGGFQTRLYDLNWRHSRDELVLVSVSTSTPIRYGAFQLSYVRNEYTMASI